MGCCAIKNRVEVLPYFSEDGQGNQVSGERGNKTEKTARLVQKTTNAKTKDVQSLDDMKEKPKRIGNGEKFGSIEEFDRDDNYSVICDQDGTNTKNIDGIKIAEDLSKVYGENEQDEDIDAKGNFGHMKGTLELKQGNAHMIPSGRKEKNHHPDQENAADGLHEKETRGDLEVKDYDEVSTNLSSSEFCILMVFCETEDLDVDVKTDTDIEIYSLGYDNGHFPGQIIKDEGVKNELFDSDLRKINDTQPTVTQPQAKDPVIKRSNMPQIIQVTSVEKSKTKYSYQYSENYCGQLERPGSRMNNKPASGATHIYQDDIMPHHDTRRGGLIQVVPKENTSNYSYKAPNPPTEALGGKPPITVTTRTKEVKDNFTDLVIKEFDNDHLDGEADDDDDETVHWQRLLLEPGLFIHSRGGTGDFPV